MSFGFILLLVLAACGAIAPEPPALHPSVTAQVDIAQVTRGDIRHLYVLPGLTRALSQPIILGEGGGSIAGIHAFPGDEVYAGQVLARFDGGFLQSHLDSIQESVLAATRLFELQHRQLVLRIEIMEAADNPEYAPSIAQLRLEADQMQRRHSQNMADQQARINELNESIAGRDILAPIAGQLAYFQLGGGWFATGDILGYISQMDRIVVEYIGDDRELFAEVESVKLFGITMDGLRHEFAGIRQLSLDEINHYIGREMSLPVQFELAEGEQPLEAGQSIFIHLYTVFAQDVLRIPSNALFNIDEGYYVHRIEDGHQVLVAVEIGVFSETYVEILGGLHEGDEVFVRPQGSW